MRGAFSPAGMGTTTQPRRTYSSAVASTSPTFWVAVMPLFPCRDEALPQNSNGFALRYANRPCPYPDFGNASSEQPSANGGDLYSENLGKLLNAQEPFSNVFAVHAASVLLHSTKVTYQPRRCPKDGGADFLRVRLRSDAQRR